MTNTMKIQRHEAKKVYRGIIDELYKEGMLKMEKKWSSNTHQICL